MAAALSFAIAGLVTTVVTAAASTALTVVSQNEQAEYQSSINEYNASIDRQNAEQAQREAMAAAGQERKANQRKLARIRAIQGARGVVDEGSPLEVLADQASQFEMQAQDIERQGEVSASAYETRANISEMRARNARDGVGLANLGTVLSGAGNVAAAGINYGTRLEQV